MCLSSSLRGIEGSMLWWERRRGRGQYSLLLKVGEIPIHSTLQVFVNYFSDALRVEYGSRGIVVQVHAATVHCGFEIHCSLMIFCCHTQKSIPSFLCPVLPIHLSHLMYMYMHIYGSGCLWWFDYPSSLLRLRYPTHQRRHALCLA